MKKLVKFIKQAFETWSETRLAYTKRNIGHQMGS